MDLSEKLNYLMKINNIKNPKELSIRLKESNFEIPYTTLLTILKGEVKDIKLNTALKLARFFNITLDELLDNNVSITNTQPLNLQGLTSEDIKEINKYIEMYKLAQKNKDIK